MGRKPGLGKARQKLPERRRCYKQHRWLVSESNLRVKRSDPWHRANASPKAMAVLVQTVQTRRDNRKRVCTWFASRWPQPPAQTSSEASLENSVSQDAGRPCYEAENSACRGEWRREAGSPARARQMPARERELGELPSPICPRLTERSGGDLCF